MSRFPCRRRHYRRIHPRCDTVISLFLLAILPPILVDCAMASLLFPWPQLVHGLNPPTNVMLTPYERARKRLA